MFLPKSQALCKMLRGRSKEEPWWSGAFPSLRQPRVIAVSVVLSMFFHRKAQHLGFISK